MITNQNKRKIRATGTSLLRKLGRVIRIDSVRNAAYTRQLNIKSADIIVEGRQLEWLAAHTKNGKR